MFSSLLALLSRSICRLQGSIRLEDGEIVCVLVGGWSLWQKKRKPQLFLILFRWLSLSGVSMYQHAMSVWFYIKSISRFPSQLVLNQLSVYWEEAFEMKVLPSDGLGIIIRVCSTWENSLEIGKKEVLYECWSIQSGSGTFPLSLPTRIFKCCGSSSLHVGRHLSRWTDCATDWVNRSKGMPQESQFTCFTIDYAVSKGQISSHRL